MKSLIVAALALLTLLPHGRTGTLFDRGATWRWRAGTTEASTPVTAWRLSSFDDSSFVAAPAPFWYGDVLTGGTQISGMQNVYLCIFLRKTFVISDPSEIASLRLGAAVDDGFIAWINGTEVQRVNMTAAGAPGTAVSISTLADNAAEPPPFVLYDLPAPSAYLVPGTNVITVQVFQSSLGSSDLGFDASLESIAAETVPPTVATINPPTGTIHSLPEMTVTFSEPVAGVDAADLLVNGANALVVTPVDPSTYTFTFQQPAYGSVSIAWRAGHGITDQAVTPNPFNASGPGATWSYNLVDNVPPRVDNLSPVSGATIRSLKSIEVLFSEPVTGVDASDLLINNTAASGLTSPSESHYIFTFPQPATGQVQVAWAPAHGIFDQALSPNAFAGGSWSYVLDPNAGDAAPYISEFMASNTRTSGAGSLLDEDGQTSDWIEIYNPGSLTVNLEGWALTDSTSNPAKWQFPATNIAGGGFLVVFASGNDRRTPGARLHTSFQLAANGEYLALVKPDGTVASEFRPAYPQQVAGVSYGLPQFNSGGGLTAGPAGAYFTTPTPGAANLGGASKPGPIIEDVQHTPNVPRDNDDLTVTARIRPSFFAVASVSLRYRVMFDNEITTPMVDDGAHGDGAAGDGVYGAIIPASASTAGEMVRYLVAATDVNANDSRWPIFTDPTAHEQYLGTVVEPSYVTSKLPIVHLFAPPTVLQPGPVTSQIGADSEGGGRVAVFYDGEFYDNVYMELRGNTSAGLNKKTHRIEFNRGHEFRHAGPGGRTRISSFLAEYLDPAYLRQHLCFWFLSNIGVKTPYDYPVRLQLNGQFYQLAFHNDVIGVEQVERMGYDPKGALYKAVGTFETSRFSTGVFQKKTEPLNDFSDYTQLAAGIAETATTAVRRNTVFDLLDLPQVINHLAGTRWCSENDDVWANMSMYRDTFGDQLWRNIPFDMNASWGQLYGGSNPLEATVDTSKSHPLYGGSTTAVGNWNRLYDVIVTLPETREMLLRRERSIMDKMIQPPGTPDSALIIENYIKYMTNLIAVEANMDRAKWGFSPWAPNKTFEAGVGDLLNQFVGPRRRHWYATHSVTNTSRAIGINSANNAGIPLEQPANASVQVAAVEFNPASHLQEQEFVCLTNPTTIAIDISGWKLDGGVNFTFMDGTVVPSRGALYVSPDVVAFRARSSGPRGGQGLFVVGPYKGQLSARGETLDLLNPAGQVVQKYLYPGNPSPAQQFLRITEIMYRPAPQNGNTNTADETEYLELQNISTTATLNLAGVRFVNGIEFSFSGGAVTTLAPGARALVVKNLGSFTARYGGGLPVAGQYVGSLDNAGERIQLLDAFNEEILDFSYNNSWVPVTDGLGFALAIVDENAMPDDWGQRIQWRASGQVNGTPGISDPGALTVAPVLVNEVLSGSTPPQVDAIELYNPTGGPADVSGWYISDDFATPRKFRIPNGTVIPTGGFVMFDESQFNVGPGAFAFSSDNDEAWLFSGEAAGTDLTGYAHGFSFGAAEAGVSFGRHLTSETNELFVAQVSPSLGSANAGPKVGPLVISEIMYHPLDLGTNDNPADEFIELHNISGAPVALYDTAAPTNTWKLTDAVDFIFPPGVIVPSGTFVIVANIDPANAGLLAAFRAKYGLSGDVPVFGPYGGKLDNSGGHIKLRKPGVVLAGHVPYILADEVDYRDLPPWPTAADGAGPSLQRLEDSAYGNDPISWVAVGPTAGVAYVPGGTPPSITVQPVPTQAVAGRTGTLSVQVAGTAPFLYQWRFRGQNVPGANTSQLTLTNIQVDQAGLYTVVVINSAGSVESASAGITVVLPPSIAQQPANRSVYIKPDPNAANLPNGTNVTFTIVASSGNSGVTYQWQFNGVSIPGATSSSFTVTNVQLEDEGDYRCIVTDSVDSVASEAARLVPLIRPVIVERPANLVVAAGSDFSMSVAVTGNPKPFAYSWRRNIGAVVISTNFGSATTDFVTLNTETAFLILTNNMLASNFTMRIVIYNDAYRAPGTTTTFTITVLEDTDRDGVPDVVELGLGLDANDPADGARDLDNDGMSNRAEFLAGTDPTNRLSYLRIEQSIASGLATVQFAATSNRTYSVQYTDALGTRPWTKLADVVARTTNFTMQIPDPTWVTNRFYRVVLPQQP